MQRKIIKLKKHETINRFEKIYDPRQMEIISKIVERGQKDSQYLRNEIEDATESLFQDMIIIDL